MKKRIIGFLLAAAMLLSLLPMASAAEIIDSGTCGENLTWTLDSDGLLTISGTGDMINGGSWYNQQVNIQAIQILEGVTSIGSSAFYGCSSLLRVTISDSVTTIGSYAFYGCSSLMDVVIGSNVTYIGNCAFQGCTALTSISIPDSVTVLGDGAFFGCTALASVELGSGFSFSYNNPFSACTNLVAIDISEENSACCSADNLIYNKALTTLFYCPEGKEGSVILPDTVSSIAEGAFTNCSKLNEILVTSNNQSYASVDGILYNKDMTVLIHCPGRKTNVSVPDGITAIGARAFWSCCNLSSVTLPASLTDIGKYAFSGCPIGSVIIPEGVTSIGFMAFRDCTALNSVYFLGNAPELGDSVFQMYVQEAQWYINIPGLTLYYIEGKEGWTSPTWSVYEYPTATWEPHTHSYTAIVTEPTCTEQGYTTYTCQCGDSYMDNYVDALGHKTEAKNAKAATCTEAGYTGDEICTICGETVKTGEAIAALGHNFVDGLCSRCGEEAPDFQPPVEFTDVSAGAWYENAVDFAVDNGLMNGVGDGKFDPEGTMTRAMLVTVLWRYAGSPTGYENTFTDLTQDWYMDAVAWAAANSIVNGVGGGKFDPDGSITREQMATILFRYCEKVGIETSARANLSIFPDGNKVSDWAKDALSWANAEGLITGSEENGTVYLLPQGNATRAQVATILMRFIENLIEA